MEGQAEDEGKMGEGGRSLISLGSDFFCINTLVLTSEYTSLFIQLCPGDWRVAMERRRKNTYIDHTQLDFFFFFFCSLSLFLFFFPLYYNHHHPSHSIFLPRPIVKKLHCPPTHYLPSTRAQETYPRWRLATPTCKLTLTPPTHTRQSRSSLRSSPA